MVARKVVEHLKDENILPETIGSCRRAKMATWRNTGTFAYDYKEFQNMAQPEFQNMAKPDGYIGYAQQ